MFRARIPQHERARKRAAVGRLRESLVKPPTLRLYHQCLKVFYLWLQFWTLPFPADVDDPDLRVCEFGEAAWEGGESRMTFAGLVSGIQHFEEGLQKHLFAARHLINAWDRSEHAAKSFP